MVDAKIKQMPLKKLPYKSLDELLKKKLQRLDDDKTVQLIKALKTAKKRGWLSKDELIKICQWKSPRAIQHIKSNHPLTIKKLTKETFETRSERAKIELLTKLKGVSIPMSSSILMLTNPKRYGVIDIRVWEVLFAMKAVETNPKGLGFNFKEWYRLLMILRFYSNKLNVNVRTVEYSIFLVHQEFQKGNLYKQVN